MSAHFDGGEEITGRRLREVEVLYVDDPTLNLEAEDSDNCPPSPPPTYYLRVRGDSVGVGGGMKADRKWAWRYVNVESKALAVWSRRGGTLLRAIPLQDVEGIKVLPDEESPSSILEIQFRGSSDRNSRPSNVSAQGGTGNAEDAGDPGDEEQSASYLVNVLTLQARSSRETLLWAKVLQENVELMTERRVPLTNLDEDTNLTEVQQLGKLLMHQLSELRDSKLRGKDGGALGDDDTTVPDKC
ncbi:unnamed protein product [Discosporangium mesarthrocarpum]